MADADQHTRRTDLPEGTLCGGREILQRQQSSNSGVNNSYQTTLCQNISGNLQLTTKIIDNEWGDRMENVDDDCYRIVSKNIGSLGVRAKSFKEDLLKKWMQEHQIQVTCIQEVNVNWAKIRGKYRIYERFKLKDRLFARSNMLTRRK